MIRIASLAILLMLSVSSQAAQVDLVCPCEIRTNNPTSLILKAGLNNRDTSASSELRMRAIAHTTVSNFDSSFFTLGYQYFTTSLTAGSTLAVAEYKTGFNVPQNGDFYVTLVLEEKRNGVWTRVDSIRTQNQITLNQSGGYSISNTSDEQHAAIFFDGEPSVQFSGSNVTINLPPIVNGSPSNTTGNLTVDIVQADGDSIFGTNFFSAAQSSLSSSLSPKTQTTSTSITTTFTEQDNAGFDFFHLRIVDTGSGDAVIFRTVRSDAGAISTRSFTLPAIEVLEDSDGDGVSNFNERLLGSSPTNSNETPGNPVIDVLVYTTQNAAAATPNNDLQTRIDALLATTNTIFKDSGTGLSFRFSDPVPINIVETTDLSTILTQMDNQTGVFSDLRTRKANTNSDIALVYLPFTSSSLCGLATLTGKGLDGDFSSVSHANNANTAVYIDCRDNVTAHEIGHLLGVTHSRVEMANENDLLGGTFPWSAGHGANNLFVTVMANSSDFGGANELNLFSSPALTCASAPCGVNRSDAANGADAALSIRTTKYQIAAFTETSTTLDTDNDGTPDVTDTDDDADGTLDVNDAFPTDSSETTDTDGDGFGNNQDTDDDNDGVLDTPDAFPTDSSRSANARLGNISTRDPVRTGDEVIIGGVIISGDAPKTVVIRARGQSLADADPNLQGLLQDPFVQLFNGASLIDSNDNWESHGRANEIRSDLRPTRTNESAIMTTLNPGAYTAIVRGVGETTGIGIVEIFEVDDTGSTRVSNISTRGFVGTGDDVLIGGVIISGSTAKTVTIRARGPSLADADPNLQNLLADPFVQLFNSSGTLIDSNDNWQSHSSAGNLRADLQPTRTDEAAITTTLDPGAYTAIVRGVGETTGIGIVEVFEID